MRRVKYEKEQDFVQPHLELILEEGWALLFSMCLRIKR